MDNTHSAEGHESVNMNEIQKLKTENLKLKEDHEKEIKILKLEHKIQILELERQNERLKHENEITKIKFTADKQGFQPKTEKSEQFDDVVVKRVEEMEKKLENKFINDKLFNYGCEANTKLAEQASALAKFKEHIERLESKTEVTK